MGNKTNKSELKEINNKDIITGKTTRDNILGTKKLSRVERVEKIAVRSESFSGPIPHPKILNDYDMICPGAADRIIKMAENQMDHRHSMEGSFLRAHSRNSFLGIVFAFALGLVITVGGILCVMSDKQVSGLILGGSGLGTVMLAFIRGTKMDLNGDSTEKKDDIRSKEEQENL
ncbi:DUF2335 domain-containing protein [Clostridium sp.]|uniref:DUF2335 domain-containing protein n=1 Tax=Clostridium sp. TaxID=1506 RepID=UPI0025BCF157|nr:DUF2335 domain-containing protein [Clostridium sp.]